VSRTKEANATYMREYRAIQRAKIERSRQPVTVVRLDAAERIDELEAEVRHLKAELAKRPPDEFNSPRYVRVSLTPTERYDTQPVRAVPKVRK